MQRFGASEIVRNINFIENYEVTCTFIYVEINILNPPMVATTPLLEILTIACLTFCLLLTDRPTLVLPQYKLKVANICKMHETGGLEVVVLCAF